MNRLVEPVGPKGKSVYLRRRIFVLLGLLAVVAAVVLIIVKPGSTGGAASSNTVELPDDLTVAEQTDGEEEGELATCADGLLLVTPITDGESYAAGQHPLLSLSVQNTGDEECSADLGTAALTFTVTSGAEEVWRSVDCQQNPDHRLVALEPGETLITEPITWDRTRSSIETCEIDRDPVVAGGASYHLRVAAAGVDGDGTKQFLLH